MCQLFCCAELDIILSSIDSVRADLTDVIPIILGCKSCHLIFTAIVSTECSAGDTVGDGCFLVALSEEDSAIGFGCTVSDYSTIVCHILQHVVIRVHKTEDSGNSSLSCRYHISIVHRVIN